MHVPHPKDDGILRTDESESIAHGSWLMVVDLSEKGVRDVMMMTGGSGLGESGGEGGDEEAMMVMENNSDELGWCTI
ncbi:hypothetical protein QVD17_07036 [Tagetes erecta]|uniref:Uncharacterized protein n=1 Tax=Tagetes erecta TaxID=13708 RepID=A0AAD8P735_TARER|nr:hypothetical protein QVD17_07036 [Tagetes erecta]